jgi:hypothetical protein
VGRFIEFRPNSNQKGCDYCVVLWADGTVAQIHGSGTFPLEPWVPREGEWVITKSGEMTGYFSQPRRYKKVWPAYGIPDSWFIPAPLGTHAEGWFK